MLAPTLGLKPSFWRLDAALKGRSFTWGSVVGLNLGKSPPCRKGRDKDGAPGCSQERADSSLRFGMTILQRGQLVEFRAASRNARPTRAEARATSRAKSTDQEQRQRPRRGVSALHFYFDGVSSSCSSGSRSALWPRTVKVAGSSCLGSKVTRTGWRCQVGGGQLASGPASAASPRGFLRMGLRRPSWVTTA